MKWEQASNGASIIDFPVVRCRLSAIWIGRFNFCHDQSLPFKDDARNKALRTRAGFAAALCARFMVHRTGQSRRAEKRLVI